LPEIKKDEVVKTLVAHESTNLFSPYACADMLNGPGRGALQRLAKKLGRVETARSGDDLDEEEIAIRDMRDEVLEVIEICGRYRRFHYRKDETLGRTKHFYEMFSIPVFEADRVKVRRIWKKLPARYSKHGTPFEDGQQKGIRQISTPRSIPAEGHRQPCAMNAKNAFQDTINQLFLDLKEKYPELEGFMFVTFGGNGDWTHLRLPDMPHMIWEIRSMPAFRVIALKPEYYHAYEEGRTAEIDPRILEAYQMEIPSLSNCYEEILRPNATKKVGEPHTAKADALMTMELFIAAYHFQRAHKRIFDDHGFVEMDGTAIMSILEREVWPKEGVPKVKKDPYMTARVKARMTEMACRVEEDAIREQLGTIWDHECGCVHKISGGTLRWPRMIHKRITAAEYAEDYVPRPTGQRNRSVLDQGEGTRGLSRTIGQPHQGTDHFDTDSMRSIDVRAHIQEMGVRRARKRVNEQLTIEQKEGRSTLDPARDMSTKNRTDGLPNELEEEQLSNIDVRVNLTQMVEQGSSQSEGGEVDSVDDEVEVEIVEETVTTSQEAGVQLDQNANLMSPPFPMESEGSAVVDSTILDNTLDDDEEEEETLATARSKVRKVDAREPISSSSQEVINQEVINQEVIDKP
jgi:hypothetical protein